MQWRIGLITAALWFSACSGDDGPTALPAISEPAAAVARVLITPSSGATKVGGAVQFVATAFDRDGNVLASTVIWQSTNDSVGEISQTGLALAKGVGTSGIRASMGGVIGTARFIVEGEKEKTGDLEP